MIQFKVAQFDLLRGKIDSTLINLILMFNKSNCS